MENNEKNQQIILCPHCNSLMNAKDQYCKSCGYVIKSSNEKAQNLHFGRKKLSKATNNSDGEEYKQELTKRIVLMRQILNGLFLLIGIICFFMFLLPLFSSNNIYTYVNNVSGEGNNLYNFALPECFKLSGHSNLITIIKSIVDYNAIKSPGINVSFMMFVYDYIILDAIVALFVIGVISIIFAIRSIFFYKANIYSKKIVGVTLTISLLMILALDCYGFGPILLAVVSGIYLVVLYIGSVISLEKPFLPRQLIHKSICCALLLTLLLLATFSAANLNVIKGANLYNGSTINAIANQDPLNSHIVKCRGLFLELMQFVHTTSGDQTFTSFAVLMNVLCLVFHVLFLCFGTFSFVSLLKSLSRQSIGFPVKRIFVSCLVFFAFSASLVIFNQLVNEVSLNNYITTEIGQINYDQLTNAQKDEIRLACDVFKLRKGFIFVMIMYLPLSIYAFIAKSICLKKTIY